MIEKFAKINNHKALYIRIQEQPIFNLAIQQIFIEDMEKFENNMVDENNCALIFTLGFQEFCVLVGEIMPYWENLKETGNMFQSLSESKIENVKEN